jgi:hypothetical protein
LPMPAEKKNSIDYQTISASAKKGGTDAHEQNTLKPLDKLKAENVTSHEPTIPQQTQQKKPISPENILVKKEEVPAESVFLQNDNADQTKNDDINSEFTYAEQQKQKKEEKKVEKDRELLSSDRWLARNGHTLTYVGLYLFSILVLFRPYELIPALGFLSATAFYFAIATLLIYLPTQFSTEGNLTILTTEVKAVLAITAIALLTLPIAKSPGLAWETFNDTFIKAVLIFIVMVNVIRTRARLMGMIWLSLSIGVVLSYLAIGMYSRGEMNVEGYRVSVQIGGMFQNPNEMSLHLIMMIPLAITLGLATKSKLMKIVYLATTIFLLSANMITFSRGGFLGLLGASAVMVWKLGRKNRIGVTAFSVVLGTIITLLAPGNYGLRVLSIFIPGLDPVGSSSQRSELLERSILVSLRNPWGIGIGNFPIVSIHELVSHNAFTQVSSELGVLGLIAYLIFMFSPFRKLAAIERIQFEKDETDWFFYLAIGLQASIVAYLIGSFFASVAYNWFIYYLIAYAVAFRRIYQIENELNEEVKVKPLREHFWSAKIT